MSTEEDIADISLYDFINWYKKSGDELNDFLSELSDKYIQGKIDDDEHDNICKEKKILGFNGKETNVYELKYKKFFYESENIYLSLSIIASSISISNFNLSENDELNIFLKNIKTSSGLYYKTNFLNKSELDDIYEIFLIHAKDMESFIYYLQSTGIEDNTEYYIEELNNNTITVTDNNNFKAMYIKDNIKESKLIKLETKPNSEVFLDIKDYCKHNRINGFGYKDLKIFENLMKNSLGWND